MRGCEPILGAAPVGLDGGSTDDAIRIPDRRRTAVRKTGTTGTTTEVVRETSGRTSFGATDGPSEGPASGTLRDSPYRDGSGRPAPTPGARGPSVQSPSPPAPSDRPSLVVGAAQVRRRDRSLDADVVPSPSDPDDDHPDADGSGQSADRAGFGAEGPAGDDPGTGLFDRDDRQAVGRSADREAVDAASARSTAPRGRAGTSPNRRRTGDRGYRRPGRGNGCSGRRVRSDRTGLVRTTAVDEHRTAGHMTTGGGSRPAGTGDGT